MILILGILMDAFFISFLAWCGYSDFKKRIIPNLTVMLLLCLGVLHTALLFIIGNTWWMCPLGLLIAIPFFISWLKNRIGAGDVKLLMAIALYLGFFYTLASFMLMIPMLIVLLVRSWIKNRTFKYQIPFAPIIAFGAIGTVLLGYLNVLI